MEILNYNECQGIVIQDQLLDDWINAPVKPELTIAIKRNCTDLVEIEMTGPLYSVPNDGVLLTPEQLGLSTDLVSTGIYTVTITSLVQDVGGQTSTDCVLIDCDLKCRVLEYLAENLDSPVGIYYETLKYLNVCTKCTCESGCLLLAEIESILNNTKTTPCGNCS